ncbi:universal stress protein [Thiohalocapsa sp. ML1]|jgi:nucleotide-binding universal stress UspA family protein|uniref:universal stress protein n=1 Tax=Thiohalocapsa sp. ML1 TaxID=1431688 RepID=UPI000731F52E|nr:universal stress protein [Thiohalocapsa sp. ML1]
MTKVLLPVDGSEFSDRALDYVLDMARGEVPLDLHLVNVQLAIDSGHARMFVSDDDIAAYHRDEGLAVLKPYRARLDAAGVSYQWHVLVGHAAQSIARFAKEQKFDRVVMGTHGRSGMTQLLMGSVAQNVIRRLKIPVALVK